MVEENPPSKKKQPENVIYSLDLKVIQSTLHKSEIAPPFSPSWLGFGTAAFVLLSGGGYMGYLAQTYDQSASSILLDKVVSKQLSKPHPFIKREVAIADSAKILQGPVSVAHVAVRALGIATVYCFTGFSVSMIGIALACGIHSKKDAQNTLENLKAWGPKKMKKMLNISETEIQKESLTGLDQVSHLPTEKQFERLFENTPKA